MSLNTLRHALKFTNDEPYITLGGGEPTLHPKFELILWECIKANLDEPPLIITNGSNTKLALLLLKLSYAGIISAELSQDEWHDPINYEVIAAYTEAHRIRNVAEHIAPVGRAATWGWSTYGCNCGGITITPVGNVYPCGCRKHSYGNIIDMSLKDYYKAVEEINENDYQCITKWEKYATRPRTKRTC